MDRVSKEEGWPDLHAGDSNGVRRQTGLTRDPKTFQLEFKTKHVLFVKRNIRLQNGLTQSVEYCSDELIEFDRPKGSGSPGNAERRKWRLERRRGAAEARLTFT